MGARDRSLAKAYVMSAELAEHVVNLAASSVAEEDFEHLALQQPHLARVATRRPSTPNLGLGDHGAIFSCAPSLRPDVPRTPGMRQMASQPAVSTGHPKAKPRGGPSLQLIGLVLVFVLDDRTRRRCMYRKPHPY
jgi:hypothetical protein